MTCRICEAPTHEVLDLGQMPPANWLKSAPEERQDAYPLVLEWCDTCSNVQLRDTIEPELLYRDYRYVTPRSVMLSNHYDQLASYLMTRGLVRSDSFVVEAGSNAGHFLERLQPHVRRVLGVDPATEIAQLASEAGVPTIGEFFDRDMAAAIVADHGKADLVVARHCLAHNPTPHPMLEAAEVMLADDGKLLIENAYVLNTLENGEFDQIYHEHMFYFSIRSMRVLLRRHRMQLSDVFMSMVHGGSIVFIAERGQSDDDPDSVATYEPREARALDRDAFRAFAERAQAVRGRVVELVGELSAAGRSIYTYGATAKGNTLLNYAGLTSATIPYCVDSTPMKQGRYLPKSNIKIISEEEASLNPPDYYLLTAWNYEDELVAKVRSAGNFSTRFIVPIPFVRIV